MIGTGSLRLVRTGQLYDCNNQNGNMGLLCNNGLWIADSASSHFLVVRSLRARKVQRESVGKER